MLFLGNTDVDYMLEQQALLEEAGLSNNKLTMEILDIDKYLVITILSKCTFLTIIPYVYTNSY